MNRQKNIIIGIMCAALVIMVTVFAAFQTQLKIGGQGSVLGSWNIEITSIKSNPTGTAYNIQEPSYTGTNATLYTGLKKPGDKMTYTITVTNNGNIDAIIDEVVVAQESTKYSTYTVSGLQQDTRLKSKSSVSFDLEVVFNSNMTYIPEDGSNSINVRIVCIQDDGQNLTPSEPIITNLTLDELQEKYVFTYYSTLNGAVNDVNNGTIGANADTTKYNAVAGIYNDHGKIYVVLLKDTTETDRVRPSVDMTINLGGNKLSSTSPIVVDIISGNITIDGRLEGSTIEAIVTNAGGNTRAIQHRSGSCTINGGTYISSSDGSNGSIAIQTGGTMHIYDATINASETKGEVKGIVVASNATGVIMSNVDITSISTDSNNYGIYTGSNTKVTILNSNISSESVNALSVSIYISDNTEATITNSNILSESMDNISYGVYLYNDADATIKDSHVLSSSINSKSYGLFIHNGVEITITNSNIQAHANYKSDYSQSSIGITSEGTLTVNNSYVMGVHSGIQSSGTFTVNGGTYEGYGHGGFYFSGTGTTSYVSNATIRQTDMPEGYTDLGGSTNNSGFYIGGNEGKDNITVYMDNCNIDGKRYPFVLRGTSGEQNNTLYISNSTINKDSTGKIRIDNDTHKLYLGVGNNFTSDDTTRPSAVITTDEVYIKP